MSAVAVGCSLGNTASVVAVTRGGNTEVIANGDGHRTTPVAIAYGEESLSIGNPAVQGLFRNSKNTALKFPKLLGRKYGTDLTLNDHGCKVVEKDGVPHLKPDALPNGVSPSELTAELIRVMWDTAETNAGPENKSMVVAVPLGASDEYKSALKASCEDAGVTVLDFLLEPVAAALGYGVGNEDLPNDETLLVYDLGASQATVTVLKVTNGCFEIVASTEDSDLGGGAVDDLLVKMLIKEFKKSSKVDISNESKPVIKLRQAAIDAKHILSTTSATTIAVESLFEGQDFQFKLSKGKFDSTLSSLYRKSVKPIEAALSACGIQKDGIGRVLLAGGSCKIGKIKKTIEMYFERELCVDSVAPDEVFALGASRHGQQLGNFDTDVVKDVRVCPNAICVKALDGTMQVVIPAKSLVPVKAELEISPAAANQGSIALEVYEQATAESAPNCIARAVLSELSEIENDNIIGSVEILVDGSLRVLLRDPKSGKTVEGSVVP